MPRGGRLYQPPPAAGRLLQAFMMSGLASASQLPLGTRLHRLDWYLTDYYLASTSAAAAGGSLITRFYLRPDFHRVFTSFVP